MTLTLLIGHMLLGRLWEQVWSSLYLARRFVDIVEET